MNIKNFPRKLDSKTSCLRIKVPENLDLALEGLIRKVLREQPATDDIYMFAANYFETLLCIRDKSGKKGKLKEVNQNLNEQERNEMTVLANSFPRPSPDKFSCSPVKNKEKRRKNSASKLVKLNSFEEKENIKPKTLSKTKLEDLGQRKSGADENIPLKNSSDGAVISSLAKTAAQETERVLNTLAVKGDLQEKNQTISQSESETESEKVKEENTYIEDDEEFLKSDPIKEMVNQELMEEASKGSGSNNELAQIQEKTIRSETENDVTQAEEAETVNKNELCNDGNKLEEEIKLESIKTDERETNKITKNKDGKEIREEEIENQKNENILPEKDNETIIKDEINTEKEEEIFEQTPNDFEIPKTDMQNDNVDGETSQYLKNDENSEFDEGNLKDTEKINFELEKEEKNEQVTEARTQLLQEDIPETSEKIDQEEGKEVADNSVVDNKLCDDVLDEKDTEAVNADDITQSKEEVINAEISDALKELDTTAKSETENLNDLMESEKDNKNFEKGKIDDSSESGKAEDEIQTKEKENKAEGNLEIRDTVEEEESKPKENEENEEKPKEKENEEAISLQPQELPDVTLEIHAETDFLKEKNSIETIAENLKESIDKESAIKNEEKKVEGEVQEMEKSRADLEATEGEDKNFIEIDNSEELEISEKNEEENLKNKGEENIEEKEQQSSKNEDITEEFSPEAKENDSKKLEKIVDDSTITETSLDSQNLELKPSEEKNLENEAFEDTKNVGNVDNETPINKSIEDATILDEPQLDKNDDAEKEEENGKDPTILRNKTDRLVDLPLETSVDNTGKNTQDIGETNTTGTLEDKEETLDTANEIGNETSVKDDQNHLNFEETELKKEEKKPESPVTLENVEVVNSVEDLKSSFANNKQNLQNEENLAGLHESEINQTAAVKTEENDLKESKYSEEEKEEKSEAIINPQKVSETEFPQITTKEEEEEESEKDLANEKVTEIEKTTTEQIETIKTEENETTAAESETKTKEHLSDQLETPRLKRWTTIDADTETIHEDSDTPINLEEEFYNNSESDSLKKNKTNKDEEKLEIDSEGHSFPEEELCSVVDINEIRRVQEADVVVPEKSESEDLKEEECTGVNKIEVIQVEEKANEAEETLPKEENMPLKTIKTHYYDFLQVPTTNIKEYKVKPVTESVTSLSPQKNTHSIIRAYQFEKETSGKELWTMIENTGIPNNETENELDDQRLEIDDLMTPSSVTSMAVSEMSIFSINETFLDSERQYSSFDKRYQLQNETDIEANQIEGDDKKDEKKEIEEIIEKKTVGKIVAVPMSPREELNETIEEENEESDSLKILKEKPPKKRIFPSKQSNGSSNNDRSIDSENFAFISVDIETVIGTQELDDDENEELKDNEISGEVPALEVEIETKVDVVSEENHQEDDKITSEQESQSIQKSNDQELSSAGNKQIDLDQSSVETTETTSSSAVTEIKRFDSSERNLTRTSTQNSLNSHSLDRNTKLGVSEDLGKKKKFFKTKSLSSAREGATDKDVWKKIENELEEAATKIQSQFRSYRRKKKLQRGDAIQITSESSRSITPVEPEVQHQQASGEFHDSIVLSVIPR